jgi:hypothetical protein
MLKPSYLLGDQLGGLREQVAQGDLSAMQLLSVLERGHRFVVFSYCISVILLTFRRTSRVYVIAPGERVSKLAAPYNLITLLLGWWGIPWGPIHSFQSLAVNLRGGHDITSEVVAAQRVT